jgi:hypothetical protein
MKTVTSLTVTVVIAAILNEQLDMVIPHWGVIESRH